MRELRNCASMGEQVRPHIFRRAPARGDKWHLDEVIVSIPGETYWLWRAVDQQGFVLDVLVQKRRDRRAAQRLLTKLLKSAVKPPRVTVTDKLKSSAAARREMKLRVEHRQHKGLNDRAENTHQPTRQRERIMKRFKSRRQAQSFLSLHDQVANLFRIPYPEHTTASAAPWASELLWLGVTSPKPTSRHDTSPVLHRRLFLPGLS
jgi:putative transposase